MIISDEGQFVIATPTKCGTTTMEAISKRPKNQGKLELVLPDRDRFVAQAHEGFFIDELDGLDTRRRQHRMAMPLGAEHYKPYLLTRNPLSRWVSVYEYLRAPQNYSQWGARAVQGMQWGGNDPAILSELAGQKPLSFKRFLEWVAEMRVEFPTRSAKRGAPDASRSYRSPWVWLDSQQTSLMFLEQNTQRKVKLIRLESLEADLRSVLNKRGVSAGGDIRMIRANRTKHPAHKHWREYWTPGTHKPAKRLGVMEECEVLGYSRKEIGKVW